MKVHPNLVVIFLHRRQHSVRSERYYVHAEAAGAQRPSQPAKRTITSLS